MLALDALGIGAGRRGDLPGVHVLRDRRGDRAPRRDPGLRRHRPGDAEPRPERRAPRGSRRGRRRSCRCTSSAARRRSRSSPSSACPLIEDAAQAFGAPGIAHDRRRLDLQLLPDEEPVRASATAGSSRRTTTSSRSASACCASTARRTRRTSSSSATTRASTSCRPPSCASSCRTSTSGTARGARRPRATRSSGSARLCELPADEPGHVYHMFVVRSPERDRIAAAPRGRRHRLGRVLRDAAPPAAGARVPRPRPRATSPRPSAPRARTWRCRSGPGSARDVQERVVDSGKRSGIAGGRPMRSPVNRHRIWQLAADAALIAAAWLLAFQLRFDSLGGSRRSTSSSSAGGRSLLVVAIKLVVFTAVRLLQPLVALRLDARHVGRAARRHRRLARRRA